MCGIVGLWSREKIPGCEAVESWLAALHHRGPDDSGQWLSPDGHTCLAHARLAIIDLSSAGHQPMQDEGGYACIVFNGEIYNFPELRRELEGLGHSFRSKSDTEVVLKAYIQWGVECVSKLNGMFAFAIYDKRTRHLFLARDRVGEKPLFYSELAGTFRFASELKALLSAADVPRLIDPAALDCYLALGYAPGERCIVQGIKKLPPGHAMQFGIDSGRSRVWRYWRIPGVKEGGMPAEADKDALLAELETLLQDSVRRQMVADVDVGILLSGGIDSSLITAMAVRARTAVKTFTICFPGHGQYDESSHAQLVATHFGTHHVELEAPESAVTMLPQLALQFDEPIIDSSMVPMYLVSKLIRDHCTVALGGDGGDELFGGYGHYSRLLWLKKYAGWTPLAIRKVIADGAAACLPMGFKGRNWAQALGTNWDTGLPPIASYFDPSNRRRLMGKCDAWHCVAEGVFLERLPQTNDLLQRATRMDFENYLAEDILVKVDRASMLNSLEVRAPLLDYRLIEFAFGKVPSRLKATSTGRKVLLKELAARLLPPSFDMKRKQGFSLPLGSWLKKGPWRDFVEDILLGIESQFFDRTALRDVLTGLDKGRSNSERVFALVMFELWRRQYRMAI